MQLDPQKITPDEKTSKTLEVFREEVEELAKKHSIMNFAIIGCYGSLEMIESKPESAAFEGVGFSFYPLNPFPGLQSLVSLGEIAKVFNRELRVKLVESLVEELKKNGIDISSLIPPGGTPLEIIDKLYPIALSFLETIKIENRSQN